MDKVLIITKLSGDGCLVKIGDKEYGFNSTDSLTDFIGGEVLAALWPKGDIEVDNCTLTIKTE